MLSLVVMRWRDWTSTVTCAGPSNLELQPAEGSECACEDFGCEG